MTVDPKDLMPGPPFSTSGRFRFDWIDLQKTARDFLFDMLGLLATFITLDQAKILENPSHLTRGLLQALLGAFASAIWRFLRANGRNGQPPKEPNGKVQTADS